jgi:hypothetical protein
MLETLIKGGRALAGNPLAANTSHHGTPLDFENPHADSMLAAIAIFPEARDEFRSLAIGRDVFTELATREIASLVLSDCTPDALEQSKALAAISPHGRRLADSLNTRARMLSDSAGEMRVDWAVADVRRGARCLARHWMPSVLRFVADRLEAGISFDDVVAYLLRWCSLASIESGVRHE